MRLAGRGVVGGYREGCGRGMQGGTWWKLDRRSTEREGCQSDHGLWPYNKAYIPVRKSTREGNFNKNWNAIY